MKVVTRNEAITYSKKVQDHHPWNSDYLEMQMVNWRMKKLAKSIRGQGCNLVRDTESATDQQVSELLLKKTLQGKTKSVSH